MVIFVIIGVGPSFIHLENSYENKTIAHSHNDNVVITEKLSAELISYNKSNSLAPDNITIIITDSIIDTSITQTFAANNQTSVFFGERKIEITYIVTTNNRSFVEYSYPTYYSLEGLQLFVYNNIFYIFIIISTITCVYLLITAIQLIYFN